MILLISKKIEGNVWTGSDRLLKFISDELIAKKTCVSVFNSKTKSRMARRVLRVDRQILRVDRRVLRVDRRMDRGVDKQVLRVGK